MTPRDGRCSRIRGRGSSAAGGWVPVADEPDHVQLFDEALCRIYEVRLNPGHTTRAHLHFQDTLYVVVSGGRFRSHNLYATSSPTRPGASTGALRTLGWLARRLVIGWLTMPPGTVLWQPHRSHPVIHRVRVARAARCPLRMVGIELRGHSPAPGLPHGPGILLEMQTDRSLTYRMRGAQELSAPGPGVLTLVEGCGVSSRWGQVDAGCTVWMEPGDHVDLLSGSCAIITIVGA